MSAAPPAARPADACASCAAWRPPPTLREDELRRVEAAGFGERPGLCRLWPSAVPKKADDWCAQFRRAAAHPQDGTGAPAQWPARTGRAAADPAKPLANFFPDEAEAFLAWAKTRPEYKAIMFDAAHPRHAELFENVQQAKDLVRSDPEL